MKIHSLQRITTLGINTQDLVEYLRRAEVIIDADAELEIMHVEGGIIDCRVTEHFVRSKEEDSRDLFQHYEELPLKVIRILDKFEKLEGEMDGYEICRQMDEELAPLGYEFDWELEGQPFNLRKINSGSL
jgi:hypothetical protein